MFPPLSFVGRIVPGGRYVDDRRLVSGGRVSICRECSGHRVFRGWRRDCRLLFRVSGGWWACHEFKAWQVFHCGGARDAPSGARRCGPPEPAEWEWETT